MSKNKRFQMFESVVEDTMGVLPITLWQDKKQQKKYCDELNKLHEENHQLKRQIGNLEHTRDFCAECCERLEKENEQLKSEIREVRGEYEQLWMRLYES